ncbi:hypothetical protein D3C79_599780 [compost metagenome]
MLQGFIQRGLQLIDRRRQRTHIDKLDGEHRVATIGVTTHQIPPLQIQGDSTARCRAQIGRKPRHRYTNKTQTRYGAALAIRAITDTTLGKQADQATNDTAAHLRQARTSIIAIAIGCFARRRTIGALTFIQPNLQSTGFTLRYRCRHTQGRTVILEADHTLLVTDQIHCGRLRQTVTIPIRDGHAVLELHRAISTQ